MKVQRIRQSANSPAGMSEPVIGILGGMGPAATADFYSKLVALTPGSTDQEHPKVVIWADPTVPDRTLALTEDGPDPTPWLIRARASSESRAQRRSPSHAIPPTPSCPPSHPNWDFLSST